MSCNILFGPQRRMVEIPAPKSGMSFGLNRGVTTSELVSGGRAVYRTPLGYKTFDMTWDGGTENLGEFMDIFEGAYGEGPFYILDPRSKGQNLLPSRWASPWQLAHVANGWGQPIVVGQAGGTLTPEDREVVFKARANTTAYQADSPFSVLIPLTYGETFNVTAWGSATGGAVLYATPIVDESPLTPIAVPLTGTRTQDIVANYTNAQMFVKLHLYVPLGSTLTLRHIELLAAPEVLRTNLATNPSAEVDVAGYSFSAGNAGVVEGARVTASPRFGIACAQATWTTASTGGSPGIQYQAAASGVAGDVRSASVWVRTNQSKNISLLLRLRSGTTNVSNTTGPTVSVPANTWTEIKCVNSVATGSYDNIFLWALPVAPGHTFAVGDTLAMDGIQIGAGASVAGTYFDGNTPMTASTAYRWTGTANNSASKEVTSDGKPWHMGRGIGAVQFSSDMQGTLVSNKVDRIGLSVGMTEVED